MKINPYSSKGQQICGSGACCIPRSCPSFSLCEALGHPTVTLNCISDVVAVDPSIKSGIGIYNSLSKFHSEELRSINKRRNILLSRN